MNFFQFGGVFIHSGEKNIFLRKKSHRKNAVGLTLRCLFFCILCFCTGICSLHGTVLVHLL